MTDGNNDTRKHSEENGMSHDTLASDIRNAVETLRRGGLILYPTDTIWGIGCDATNPEAVQKVFELKQRADHKAMIVLVNSLAMLERYVDEVPEVAYQLLDVAVRPTTIIYDMGRGLAPGLLGSDGSVGIRITSERFSAELCRRFGRPVVSTSANISGTPSPRFFKDIRPEIIDGVDYAVRFRRNDNCPHTASSVIKLSRSGVVGIIRP